MADPLYPDHPGFKEHSTSKDAADAIAPHAAGLRALALQVLKRRPLTADEIAAGLKTSVLAMRPRISELARMGLIVKTGERRTNASGQTAHVWRAA